MIRVSHLTKRFPGRLAVDDVSFEVTRGEIVGFLGPNGAGKTTTMRMLTGFLPATGGDISVAGRDVVRETREVQRRIGYLPENCPLYTEMRVKEYLHFRARLKGVAAKKVRKRVAEVQSLCGLEEVGRRIIGQLSKGFKQRVGLAEALVHDPDLLILDEPTIGLDPNQIRQVRTLIKELGKRHTILLSTHILPEVEMTCDRVLIINKGKVIASGTPESLRKRSRATTQVIADIHGPEVDVSYQLKSLPGVEGVDIKALNDWLVCTISCGGEEDLRPKVFELAARNRWLLRELRWEKQSLEEVFVTLTGRDTRSGSS